MAAFHELTRQTRVLEIIGDTIRVKGQGRRPYPGLPGINGAFRHEEIGDQSKTHCHPIGGTA